MAKFELPLETPPQPDVEYQMLSLPEDVIAAANCTHLMKLVVMANEHPSAHDLMLDILREYPDEIGKKNSLGFNALFVAIMNFRNDSLIRTVEILLAYGVPIQTGDHMVKSDPLWPMRNRCFLWHVMYLIALHFTQIDIVTRVAEMIIEACPEPRDDLFKEFDGYTNIINSAIKNSSIGDNHKLVACLSQWRRSRASMQYSFIDYKKFVVDGIIPFIPAVERAYCDDDMMSSNIVAMLKLLTELYDQSVPADDIIIIVTSFSPLFISKLLAAGLVTNMNICRVFRYLYKRNDLEQIRIIAQMLIDAVGVDHIRQFHGPNCLQSLGIKDYETASVLFANGIKPRSDDRNSDLLWLIEYEQFDLNLVRLLLDVGGLSMSDQRSRILSTLCGHRLNRRVLSAIIYVSEYYANLPEDSIGGNP